MSYARRARQIVNDCLRLAGLGRTHRCTQIHVLKDLRYDAMSKGWPRRGKRAYGTIHWTGERTFVLGLHAGMNDAMLRRTIGHEIGHILTAKIIDNEGPRRNAWEEKACNLIGGLLARSMEA